MTKVKCDIPQYSSIGANVIRVSGGMKSVKPHYYDNQIVSLEISNKIVSTGEIITFKKNSIKINIIQRRNVRNVEYYDLKTCNKNKSSLFVTPMLGGTRSVWHYNRLHFNTFIDKDNKLIQLLYKNSNDPLFLNFKKAVTQFKNYQTHEIIADGKLKYILFTFKVPEQQKKHYDLFLNGKYSKFSRDFKLKILEYHELEVDHFIGQILFRSKRRKAKLEKKIGEVLPDGAELFSIPNFKDELFNKNYYL
jgi:hypothetical protein